MEDHEIVGNIRDEDPQVHENSMCVNVSYTKRGILSNVFPVEDSEAHAQFLSLIPDCLSEEDLVEISFEGRFSLNIDELNEDIEFGSLQDPPFVIDQDYFSITLIDGPLNLYRGIHESLTSRDTGIASRSRLEAGSATVSCITILT